MLLSDEDASATLDRVRELAAVTHTASGRLVVVEPTQAAPAAALRKLDGVVSVTSGALPAEALERLGAGEQLFAAAWASRMQEAVPRERPGDGRTWDAPGFTPPDPPRR